MKMKIGNKAGIKDGKVDKGLTLNHNETLASDAGRALKVRTNIKAGHPATPGIKMNHNQTLVRKPPSLNVKTGIKAGGILRSDRGPRGGFMI